ncbi:hypothetical protein K469DRAFT_586944 [Zopfia rhizophila CBS 207.26]|uniref:Complex 1 LYR protein domain-containing protein n=1 Tax=Zopfia rhizophila CBS 207.26 TaxID=1314779 RepID=A0A6A6DVI2_9PEZI|nr:hypothetical protein K469DRAFT_586944 [Zopfia rhizophila CBS 207.26]
MPRFLLPRRSTPHRVAAIALYRALLSRCASSLLPDEQRNSLQNAIRNQFRKNRKLQSPYQLGLTFQTGYKVLDHLDESNTGSTTSTQFLVKFVTSLPRHITRPRRTKSPLSPPHPLRKKLACLPPEKAVLSVRPYTKVSGPRHVPILCSANGIPFLRLKKPQPPSLSRILRQKLDKRIKKFDQKTLLLNYWMPLAKHEDEWDYIIRRELGGEGESVKWVDAVRKAEIENTIAYERDIARTREIAERMQRIVDSETALAIKEGQKVVRGRRRRKP